MILRDILHHPELYVAYPSLAQLPIKLIEGIANGDLAAYREAADGSEVMEVVRGAPRHYLRGALVLEVQRAINRIEGW